MSEKKNINIKLNYDTFEDGDNIAPVFKSRTGVEHVPYGDASDGKKIDTYPDDLINYKHNCAMHNAILEFKISQVAGTGFESDDDYTINFLNHINEDEDANELLMKLANDLELFGGFSMIINWSTDWKSIISIEYVSFDKIRSGKVNEMGKVDTYYYSYDWNTQRVPRTEIPAFNHGKAKTRAQAFTEAIADGDNKELSRINLEKRSQLLYYKNYTPGSFYYPLPNYVACISAIRADVNTDIYAEKVLKNGFSTTKHINIVGNYEDEQKLEEVMNINDNYVGAENAGTPFITFSTDKDTAPIVNDIKTAGNEETYNSVNDNVRQKILSGHRVTSPLLMGIALSGTLGNRDEMVDAYELFFTNVIKPEQFKIVKVFNKLLAINGLGDVTIGKLNLLADDNELENNKE